MAALELRDHDRLEELYGRMSRAFELVQLLYHKAESDGGELRTLGELVELLSERSATPSCLVLPKGLPMRMVSATAGAAAQKVLNAACTYEIEPYEDNRAALFEAVREFHSSDHQGGGDDFECPHCQRELLDRNDIFMCAVCGRLGCFTEGVGGCIPGGPGIGCPGCGGPDETAFGESQ